MSDSPRSRSQNARPVHTYSIVAFDAGTGEHGVGVQSRYLAVGAIVPYARGGVGAAASQSYALPAYGVQGIEALARGLSPTDAIEMIGIADSERDRRQVGIVDSRGRAATYTGTACHEWAGGRTGDGYAAQGNLLTGPDVVDAMAERFEASGGPLADRILSALDAAQAAGGDRRGQQSAALLVVAPDTGYGARNDLRFDLRVDDHALPLEELRRLLRLWREFFGS